MRLRVCWLTSGEASPEKAGVGGSTPSLASIFSSSYVESPKNLQPCQPTILAHLCSVHCFAARLHNGFEHFSLRCHPVFADTVRVQLQRGFYI